MTWIVSGPIPTSSNCEASRPRTRGSKWSAATAEKPRAANSKAASCERRQFIASSPWKSQKGLELFLDCGPSRSMLSRSDARYPGTESRSGRDAWPGRDDLHEHVGTALE